MPIPIIGEIYYNGLESVPWLSTAIRFLPWLAVIYILKLYFNGTQNSSERIMHSKVAIVTGGTSGIGRAIVEDLAARGTQLILLTKDPADEFIGEYIEDLRERHGNELIYAEHCDLSDLYSIRRFATKFIDNSPPRRLDLVVCCAGLMAPPTTPRTMTKDGVESHLGINYLAHFHLLNLLSPVLKVQPTDRDVRILLATCSSHILGELDLADLQFLRRKYPTRTPWRCYGASKLALMTFGVEFQRRLWAYKRPDGEKMNVRVYNIDPGLARTPGARRWLSFGSVFGLFVYLLTYPIWLLVLKGGQSAAQTFLTAIMDPAYEKGEGGNLLKECKVQTYRKKEITDPEFGGKLWEVTEKMIESLEKESAKRRAIEKKKSPGASPKEKEEEEQDKELKEKLRKKAQEQAARKALLDKLIKEEEAKMGSLDLPARAKPAGPEVPDTPSRNTRSRSKTPVPQTIPEEGPERPDTPSKNTRRRTKKT